MGNSTKELILEYMRNLSEHFDFTMVHQLTASTISDEMHISRSLASQYLNELVKEKRVIKVNSRPVYFLHRKKMEELYATPFQEDDFYDLEEVKEYIKNHSKGEGDYSQIIGWDKSLVSIIKQVRESFEYPTCGLPMIIYGEKGTGKRTLCTTIFQNAARRGVVYENTKLIKLELTTLNSATICEKIFGTSQKTGLLDQYDHLVLMLCGAQYMDEDFQEKLAHLLEMTKHSSMLKGSYKNKHIRYMILCDSHPQGFMNEQVLKNIPVIVNMPTLQERSKEEIEELIVFFVKSEGKIMNKNIKISSVVLRALVNGVYDNNLIGLKSTIQVICASALRTGIHKDEIIIHTYDLPKYLLGTLPIVTDENVVYIDTSTYQRSEEVDYILDYFKRIIKPFEKINDLEMALKECKHNFDLLSDYLSFKQRILPEKIQGIETSLNHILDVILKRRFMNLPSGFCTTLAKLIYINELYSASVIKWQQDHRSHLDEVNNCIKEKLFSEVLIVNEMKKLMNANLEIDVNDMLYIMMIVYLHHYNVGVINRNLFGLIVCHGYSTATSIAEAVNTLLGYYVFEAVDMPLDITVDEIKDIIVERINRMHHQADVIVMVDMGSLEQLGNSLNQAINCNVGVINNVSTRTALNAGYCILDEKNIEETLKSVSKHSQAHYTIVNRKKNDVILFTSESGLHMAQRMRELFESSFPSSIPVDLEVCDYNELLTNGMNHERFHNNNVLFITGTANPHIENQSFVALEEIISGKDINLMMNSLSQYLDLKELKQFLDDLRKNFTLQNVVSYLTILNPKVLLDSVSYAVDNLQDRLNQRFSGKTLIGIYIHVCCLIERLVTKCAITEFAALKQFESQHHEFILNVQDAFSSITRRYNVTIPTSEIAYLYDFIVADEKNNLELVSRLK